MPPVWLLIVCHIISIDYLPYYCCWLFAPVFQLILPKAFNHKLNSALYVCNPLMRLVSVDSLFIRLKRPLWSYLAVSGRAIFGGLPHPSYHLPRQTPKYKYKHKHKHKHNGGFLRSSYHLSHSNSNVYV